MIKNSLNVGPSQDWLDFPVEYIKPVLCKIVDLGNNKVIWEFNPYIISELNQLKGHHAD